MIGLLCFPPSVLLATWLLAVVRTCASGRPSLGIYSTNSPCQMVRVLQI